MKEYLQEYIKDAPKAEVYMGKSYSQRYSVEEMEVEHEN